MFGTDLDDLDGLVIAAEAVDADHHPPAILDRLLESVCALLDGILREPGLDRLDRATPPVHLVDQRPGARFQLGGQRLHQVAPTQRIGDARHIGLVGDDLLRSHRECRRGLRREPERLIEGIGVQALGAAQDGAHRL